MATGNSKLAPGRFDSIFWQNGRYFGRRRDSISIHAKSAKERIKRLECKERALRVLLDESGPTNLQASDTSNGSKGEPIVLSVEIKLKRCGREMRLIIPGPSTDSTDKNPVPALLKAVGRANEWVRQNLAGEFKDQRAIASGYGLREQYVSKIIQSAFLAPKIVESILDGSQAPTISLATLLDEVPLSWADQAAKYAAL